MVSSFDLLLLPIVHFTGPEPPELPGLYVANPPRRPARGRGRDQLFFYFSLGGDAPLSSEQTNELLAGLANIYYRTSGSVTSVQRIVAEALNEQLLSRNLRSGGAGHQAIGLLTQVVLRSDRLYLAQSGSVHAFLIAAGQAQHFHDSHLAGRGLGFSRTTTIRYSQVNLTPNDVLILTAKPPLAWSKGTLQNAHRQGIESLRRYLLNHIGPGVNALLVQVQPGKGELRLLRLMRPPRLRPTPSPATPEATEKPPETEEITSAPDVLPETKKTVPAISQLEAAEELPLPPEVPVFPTSETETAQPAIEGSTPAWQVPAQEIPATSGSHLARRRVDTTTFLSGLSVIGRALGNAARETWWGFQLVARRVLPDEGLFKLPASTMIFVALAIPLVLVALASAVYFQRGRAAQYEMYFTQAQEAALEASNRTETMDIRLAWERTLRYIEAAESYLTTAESEALRKRALGVLDGLDYVERLDFRHALTTRLNENAHISRMVATDNDLYMLNSKEGVVLRATFTSSGYALDPTFQCGPGPYGGYLVGSIIDIAALPPGTDLKPTVVGIDANGNLLYCIPDDTPLAAPLAPPGTNWGSLQGLELDSGDLYILDPLGNAVWVYRGMQIAEQPRLFFAEQIPPMQQVIDLTVNRNDLFLLHTDGHLTKCIYSALIASPTRCEDPATYVDPRPGRETGPTIQGAYFTEILFVTPPDPSIYMLEPTSRAIYQFGVGLTFHKQYQSQNPLPKGPATAFTISKGNRAVFMAIGNQVFSANLP